MAKSKFKTNPLAATETEAAEAGAVDKLTSRGIGLKNSEWAIIDQLAAEMPGMNPHRVLTYAVRYFLKDYTAGKIKLETKVKKVIEFPEL